MARTNIRGTQIVDASVDLTVDVTGTLPLGNGGTGGTDAAGARTGIGLTGMATAATASTIAQRDANGNVSVANLIEGYTTTATAAGTTTLTVSSNYLQYFTGSTTQTVTMPVASTLVLGQQWLIVNSSTGAVTVQSSGANSIVVIAAGTSAMLTCILASGTSAASWQAAYFGDVVTSGKKLAVSNTLTLAGTDGTTMTFPSSSDTVAGLAAVQTITGAWSFNDGKLILNGSSSGSSTLKATAAASGTLTLPAATDTVVGKATTDTLTNKRITARIGTTASSSTPTPDADAHDQYNVTALAANATWGAPTGTPTDGQKLTLRIKDNGTARTLGWNSGSGGYRAMGVTLPTTTVISKTLYLGMVWNAADSKWDVLAVGQEA